MRADDRTTSPDGRWQWLDLRLVPAAGAVWAMSLTAPFLAPWALVAGALGALGAAVCVRRRHTAAATTLRARRAARLAPSDPDQAALHSRVMEAIGSPEGARDPEAG